jgi:hypothetical protein
MVYACNPSTLEAVGIRWAWGYPGLHSETLSQIIKTKNPPQTQFPLKVRLLLPMIRIRKEGWISTGVASIPDTALVLQSACSEVNYLLFPLFSPFLLVVQALTHVKQRLYCLTTTSALFWKKPGWMHSNEVFSFTTEFLLQKEDSGEMSLWARVGGWLM